MKFLKGKTAVITGSTSGIGLGIAEVLAEQGVHIMLNGLGDSQETIERVEADIMRHEITLKWWAPIAQKYHHGLRREYDYSGADIGNSAQAEAMVKHAAEEFGSVDILVNNAGIQYVSPIESFPVDKWNQVLATNLSAAFYTSRAAIPMMRKKKWGRIINVSSVHGLVASAEKAAYVSAKHGLIGLTKVAALELAGSGVTCNAICPGWVLTPLVQKQIDAIAQRDHLSNEEASKKLLQEKQPSMQFATPEQIGKLVLFLCSDAASQVTGSAYSIDGGWSAR